MKYMVIAQDTLVELQNGVNHAIKNGWKLQGGVAVSIPADKELGEYYFCQAMTFEDAPKQDDILKEKALFDQFEIRLNNRITETLKDLEDSE